MQFARSITVSNIEIVFNGLFALLSMWLSLNAPPGVHFGLLVIAGTFNLPPAVVIAAFLGAAWLLTVEGPVWRMAVGFAPGVAYIVVLLYGVATGKIAIIGLLAVLYLVTKAVLIVLYFVLREYVLELAQVLVTVRKREQVLEDRLQATELMMNTMMKQLEGHTHVDSTGVR